MWYSRPMDIERTIQFILEIQARSETRIEKSELRIEKSELRAAAMEKRLDKRMDSITKLLQQGMRMLVKSAEAQKRTDLRLAELAAAQRATDRSLKAFIDSMRHGRNG